MWTGRYWATRYWNARYWAKAGANPVVGATGVGFWLLRSRRRLRDED